MRGVSCKAMLFAAVAYALTFVFVAATTKALMASALFAAHGHNASRAFDGLHSMPAVAIAGRLLAMFAAALAAGYVAARTTQTKHILNGTLATINPVLINLYVLTFSSTFRDVDTLGAWLSPLSDVVMFVGGPMLGALGGYLAELRQLHLAVFADAAQNAAPPEPKAI